MRGGDVDSHLHSTAPSHPDLFDLISRIDSSWDISVKVVAILVVAYAVCRRLGLTEGLDGAVAGGVQALSVRLSARSKIQARWPQVQAKINALLGDKVVLHGLRVSNMPRPIPVDAAEAVLPDLYDKAVLTTAKSIRAAKHFPPMGENLSHGLVLRETGDAEPFDAESDSIKIKRTDYATIEALRQHGRPGTVVTAGAVLYCKETDEILLQLRAAKSATHPDCLHTFGGNYEPFTWVNERDDAFEEPLRHTAIREVGEETGIADIEAKRAAVLIAEQLPLPTCSTGFVQYYYMGVYVSRKQLARIKSNDQEGRVYRFTLEAFRKLIKRGVRVGRDGREHPTAFVPSGLAHVLVWLGLGAPDQTLRCPIEARALATYRDVMHDIEAFLRTNEERLYPRAEGAGSGASHPASR